MVAPTMETAPRRAPLAARLIATAFGAGYLPVAPGTWGTLAAVPLAIGLDRLGEGAYLAGATLVALVGSWAAAAYCRGSGREDDQRVVIDEVAGYLVTLAPVARSPANLAMGFALFRLFDIWKPPPVRWIDRHVHGGLGVVADDLAAGVYGALALLAIDRLHLFSSLVARFR
jgi:phosphatidylglycerophosphatase A